MKEKKNRRYNVFGCCRRLCVEVFTYKKQEYC